VDLQKIRGMKNKGARLITISSNGRWIVYHFDFEGRIHNLKFPAKNVPSITKIYPGAEMYEREIMEKYGVKFRGHPKPFKLFT